MFCGLLRRQIPLNEHSRASASVVSAIGAATIETGRRGLIGRHGPMMNKAARGL